MRKIPDRTFTILLRVILIVSKGCVGRKLELLCCSELDKDTVYSKLFRSGEHACDGQARVRRF